MPVHYEKRDHVGIVTLSRPGARNASALAMEWLSPKFSPMMIRQHRTSESSLKNQT